MKTSKRGTLNEVPTDWCKRKRTKKEVSIYEAIAQIILIHLKWNLMLDNPVPSFCIHANFFQIKFVFFLHFSPFFENNKKHKKSDKVFSKRGKQQNWWLNTKVGNPDCTHVLSLIRSVPSKISRMTHWRVPKSSCELRKKLRFVNFLQFLSTGFATRLHLCYFCGDTYCKWRREIVE